MKDKQTYSTENNNDDQHEPHHRMWTGVLANDKQFLIFAIFVVLSSNLEHYYHRRKNLVI